MAAALFGPSMPHASACSCASYDVRERLAEVDGAFVGALVARHDPPLGGVMSSAEQIRYTFAVERGVKGDIPSDTIDVWASSSGASCGLETPVGERAGLLLERDGDRWTSNLCSQADPDVLIRAGQPLPAPDGRAPPAVLVGTSYGPGRMLALDGSGRVITFGSPGPGTTTDIAFCAGRPLLAEAYVAPGEESAYQPGIALRTTPDLAVAWERPLGPTGQGYIAVADVACRPAGDSADVLAVTTQEIYSDSGARRVAARILAFGRDGAARTLWEGDATGGTFSPDARTAWLTAGPDGRDLVKVDLADPANTVVTTVTKVPAGLGPLALSPTGRHLAGATTHQSWTGTGSPPPTTAVLIDVTGAPKITETELGPYGRYSAALWAGPDRIVFSPAWDGGSPVRIFDTALTEVGSWPGWAASHATVVGDNLVGLNGPKVVTAPLATGPITRWSDLESGVPGTITAYPDGAPIGAPATEPSTTTTTSSPSPAEETGEQAIAHLPGDKDRGLAGRPLLAGGAGAALLAAALAGFLRRRRLPKLPPL